MTTTEQGTQDRATALYRAQRAASVAQYAVDAALEVIANADGIYCDYTRLSYDRTLPNLRHQLRVAQDALRAAEG